MNDKLICIYTGTEVTVNLLKGILEEAGIGVFVQDDFRSGIAAGFFGGSPSAVDLFIEGADLEKAKPIVREFKQRNE
ncbi:MAG: DUF2007 domain-containing protein [Mangrovibacterium sp.]|nr:DUF2007 domain-containing protein [Mangrovibacterium sp.]